MEGEIIFLALVFLVSALVAVIFFCSVETAPIIAREVARTARFSGFPSRVKLVRFW